MLNFGQNKDYTYIMNILTVGLCLFSVLAGLVQRYTHRFKYLQLSGLAIRIMQVTFYLRKRHAFNPNINYVAVWVSTTFLLTVT